MSTYTYNLSSSQFLIVAKFNKTETIFPQLGATGALINFGTLDGHLFEGGWLINMSNRCLADNKLATKNDKYLSIN